MEKPLKVVWNGKLLREIYPHATKWQVFKYKVKKFLRKMFILTSVVVAIAVIFEIGGIFNPRLQYEQVEAVKEVEIAAPIMDKIADCESGVRTPNGKAVKGSAKHYGKSGQVLMVGNNNNSVDVGKYAINSVWFGKATELGYDITIESENQAMAYWIYKNRGTGDWSSSANCWK